MGMSIRMEITNKKWYLKKKSLYHSNAFHPTVYETLPPIFLTVDQNAEKSIMSMNCFHLQSKNVIAYVIQRAMFPFREHESINR